MSQFYFQDFPEITYRDKIVKDIMIRYQVREIVKNRVSAYYTYHVEDGERPDIVAEKYYGDPRLDWLIFITNDIFDPEYDWPLSSKNLRKLIIKKYGSIAEAHNRIHHYEKIVTPKKTLFNGNIVQERAVIIDYKTYTETPTSDTRKLSLYDYELKKNDEKANIRLMEERHVNSVLTEIEGIFE